MTGERKKKKKRKRDSRIRPVNTLPVKRISFGRGDGNCPIKMSEVGITVCASAEYKI